MFRKENRKTSLEMLMLSSVLALFTTIGYLTYLKLSSKVRLELASANAGCEYLGRIIGADNIAVVRCNGEVIVKEFK